MNRYILVLATVVYCCTTANSADTYTKLRMRLQLGTERQLHTTFYLTKRTVRIQSDDLIPGERFSSICDGKRYFALDDKHQTYTVARVRKHQPAWLELGVVKNTRRTGVTVDLGERKDFFGHTARHLVTTYKVAGSSLPETTVDGWYIDIPAPRLCLRTWGPPFFDVDSRNPSEQSGIPVAVQFTATSHWKAKFGGKEFDIVRTETLETSEFSEEPLDLSLFKVPAGYKKVQHISPAAR